MSYSEEMEKLKAKARANTEKLIGRITHTINTEDYGETMTQAQYIERVLKPIFYVLSESSGIRLFCNVKRPKDKPAVITIGLSAYN